MPRELSVYRLTQVSRGDVRLPAFCPAPVVPADLLASVRAHGVLVPILVRPATRRLHVQPGRLGHRAGYFLVESGRGSGGHYRGDPPFFPTRAAAVAAMGPDVPFEVVDGRKRWAAARACRLRALPVVIAELTDAEAAEMAGAPGPAARSPGRPRCPRAAEVYAYCSRRRREGATLRAIVRDAGLWFGARAPKSRGAAAVYAGRG